MTALTSDRVLDVVRDAVGIVLELDPATVTLDSRLVQDLRADSLALVAIVDVLEEQLAQLVPGFEVDDADIDTMTTVGEVVDYAVRRGSGRPT